MEKIFIMLVLSGVFVCAFNLSALAEQSFKKLGLRPAQKIEKMREEIHPQENPEGEIFKPLRKELYYGEYDVGRSSRIGRREELNPAGSRYGFCIRSVDRY